MRHHSDTFSHFTFRSLPQNTAFLVWLEVVLMAIDIAW